MGEIVRNLEQAWTAERDKPVEDALAYRLTDQPLETCLAVSCSLRGSDRQTHKPTPSCKANRGEVAVGDATRQRGKQSRQRQETEAPLLLKAAGSWCAGYRGSDCIATARKRAKFSSQDYISSSSFVSSPRDWGAFSLGPLPSTNDGVDLFCGRWRLLNLDVRVDTDIEGSLEQNLYFPGLCRSRPKLLTLQGISSDPLIRPFLHRLLGLNMASSAPSTSRSGMKYSNGFAHYIYFILGWPST